MDEKELAARETALAEKEATLAKKEEKLTQQVENIIHKGAKEHFYDKIKISVRTLDFIIALCFVGIVVALVLGIIA